MNSNQFNYHRELADKYDCKWIYLSAFHNLLLTKNHIGSLLQFISVVRWNHEYRTPYCYLEEICTNELK